LFSRNLDKASVEIKERLLLYAREKHRTLPGTHYTERTGNLRRATKVEGNLKKKIELYVDNAMVKYGNWILSGDNGMSGKDRKTWNNGLGDPFIDEAFNANEEWIQETLDRYTKSAIADWGRIPVREE
jgi:hypothetical protein